MHEVVVNSPRAVRSLAELTLEEITTATAAWAQRIHAHRGQARYVHVCINERREAGATLAHSHAQVFALGFVPDAVVRETERAEEHFRRTGRLLHEEVVRRELSEERRVIAVGDAAVLLAPFASPTPYRLAILPRTSEPQFELSRSRGSKLLHDALLGLRRVLEPDADHAPPINIWIRTATVGRDHTGWRIELAPRLGQPAGFELGTGAGINAVSPEHVAHELREALG
jgi:UDPglucose--hexose-1-phosphate uridylyltransferase